MPLDRQSRKFRGFAGFGIAAAVAAVPVVFIGLIIWGKIHTKLDPLPAMRHAMATEANGFEAISTSEENLDRLVVTKVFLGPAVDRPQDHIIAPGAGFQVMGRPHGQTGAEWLVFGKYSDGCSISVDRVVGGDALRNVSKLSDGQRDEVSRGEKLVLVMQFACGEG
ncbi:hypothetical protein [Nocardia bovistercoris]|uniref:Uncharacterized protein n=1 Tax=Nocardia bovistercoris TaxID=2785916 RepID=A0A931N8H2_9NOCA|nr:hypothetical protein [Nocardia bovistercoris]MBH0781778.1 hypothetical protein [Nocardia bovistercoris]